MNIIILLFSSLQMLIFQPLPPGGDGDTGVDDLPIDNYILIGMIVAVLISLVVIRKFMTKAEKI